MLVASRRAAVIEDYANISYSMGYVENVSTICLMFGLTIFISWRVFLVFVVFRMQYYGCGLSTYCILSSIRQTLVSELMTSRG